MVQIIGAGPGRTGTASLRLAFLQLGFTRVYHMHEIRSMPPIQMRSTFTNWIKAFELKREGKKVECQKILYSLIHGYDVLLDHPVCHFYEELAEMYPNAIILLSTSSNPKNYGKSVSSTIGKICYSTSSAYAKLASLLSMLPTNASDLTSNFFAIPGQRFDRSQFIDSNHLCKFYNWHVNSVKNHFERIGESDRLVIYHVKQGWKPICRATNMKIPHKEISIFDEEKQTKVVKKTAKKFPHVNANQVMTENLKKFRIATILSLFMYISLAALLTFKFYYWALILISLMCAWVFIAVPILNRVELNKLYHNELYDQQGNLRYQRTINGKLLREIDLKNAERLVRMRSKKLGFGINYKKSFGLAESDSAGESGAEWVFKNAI